MEKNSKPRFTEIDGIYQNSSANSTGIAKIMCVGDLMGEPKMQEAAFFEGAFDFRKNFKYVKDIFKTADLVLGNLETMICSSAPYSMELHEIVEQNRKTYRCNSPVEYLDALRYAGFDMFPMSNNHNLDCGIDGIKEMLSNLHEYGFGNTGLFLTEHEKRHLLINVNGIRLGVLSYSTWFNRKENNLTKDDQAAIINIYSAESAERDIARAKEDGAEFILIYMHWGEESEYSHQVGAKQKKIAQEIADAGADYIIGSHPHALQEYDRIKSADDRDVPVAYSLGNFLTSDGNWITRKNAIFSLILQKTSDSVRIVDECYIPCYVANSFIETSYVIIPSIKELNGGLDKDFLKETDMLATNIFNNKIKPYGYVEPSVPSSINILSPKKNLINIHQPEIIQVGNKSRLRAQIDIEGSRKEIWYEVPREYEKYLCDARSDAFLCGVIPHALRRKCDITCVTPATEELLYNLNKHILPILAKTEPTFSLPKIIAPFTSEIIENEGGVGTGLSCGIDSFHSIINHWNAPPETPGPRLTHALINNIGSFHIQSSKNYGKDRIKKETYARARKVAKELNIPLIETDSNIADIIGGFHLCFSLGFAVMSMRKLWKTYLHGSGFSYDQFALNPWETEQYDLLSTTCLSTPGLRFYSEGASETRVEKTAAIADLPCAHKYLHVCWREGNNCGLCSKCRRTMLTLYILGKLDNFKGTFNIDYFYKNINEYWHWLGEKVLKKDFYAIDIYNFAIKGKYAENAKSSVEKLKAQ